MRRGTQVAYIPNHACGNIKHADVEFGFIYPGGKAGTHGNAVFVRYWRKGHLGGGLRTVANGELTPLENIVVFKSVPQAWVADAIRLIQAGR